MTPFNLEEAKKGKRVVTREGYAATYVTTLQNIPAPLIMEVNGIQENYYLNGRFETVHEHGLDLFMEDTLVRDIDKVRESGYYWVRLVHSILGIGRRIMGVVWRNYSFWSYKRN